MKIDGHYELIRKLYVQIGSGKQDYIPQAINCTLKDLNDVAADKLLVS